MAVALAAATAAGAWVACPIPVVAGVALVASALLLQRPGVLVVGTAIVASSLSTAATAGTAAPLSLTENERTVASLVSDPTEMHGTVRAIARVGGRHVELVAERAPADALREALAGEEVRVAGRAARITGPGAARLAARHVGWRLRVRELASHGPGRPHARVANHFRRTLERGAHSLPPTLRPLFAGLVYGDDRGQDVAVASDFRSSGLSHLLAVSGQNVAFALALAAPGLRRLRLWPRFACALAVLAAFGVLTRWEPSVLRATAMAAISLLAGTLGRPASRVRILALAVTAALLADPLLVRTVGFQLSVAACAGIATMGGPVAERLRGPAWLRESAATSIAAQAGVAPLLVAVFGGVPVISVVANVLAAPAAGPVMIWGAVAGALAGVAAGPLAAALHLPTSLLLSWIAGVARWCAALPVGRAAAGATLLVIVATVLWLTTRWRRVAVIALIGAVVTTVTASPPDGAAIAPGARLWSHGGSTVLVVGRASAGRTLDALHAARVARLDILVLTTAGAAETAAAIRSRYAVAATIAPEGTKLGAFVTPPPGSTLRAGRHIVRIRDDRPSLVVEVGR